MSEQHIEHGLRERVFSPRASFRTSDSCNALNASTSCPILSTRPFLIPSSAVKVRPVATVSICSWILDELGYVPASKTGAELLFDVIATAYERSWQMVTTNLPFEHWTEVLGNEHVTGAA